jgi:protein-S-isoprenylcysteine O-methyltransferase Ste14
MTPRKINPPHYFLLALLVMVDLRFAVVSPALLGVWAWSGILPLMAGLAIVLSAARQFTLAGTNIVPLTPSTALITDGMFAWSRNPMYLGLTVMLVGAALLIDRALPWLVVVAFVITIRLRFIRHEERLMEATFGAEYLAYRQRVRRWF